MKNSWIVSAAVAAVLAAGCASEKGEADHAKMDHAMPAKAAAAAAKPAAPMSSAKAMSYTAALAASPGVTSTGTGTGAFTYDAATHTLTYNVTYTGLSGPAVAAHIHGPAEPGANAGVVVPFASAASPISGTAVLTDAQATDLAAGKYYVNVHTAANKGGEIRGQITKPKM